MDAGGGECEQYEVRMRLAAKFSLYPVIQTSFSFIFESSTPIREEIEFILYLLCFGNAIFLIYQHLQRKQLLGVGKSKPIVKTATFGAIFGFVVTLLLLISALLFVFRHSTKYQDEEFWKTLHWSLSGGKSLGRKAKFTDFIQQLASPPCSFPLSFLNGS